jgi:hypothetical protein
VATCVFLLKQGAVNVGRGEGRVVDAERAEGELLLLSCPDLAARLLVALAAELKAHATFSRLVLGSCLPAGDSEAPGVGAAGVSARSDHKAPYLRLLAPRAHAPAADEGAASGPATPTTGGKCGGKRQGTGARAAAGVGSGQPGGESKYNPLQEIAGYLGVAMGRELRHLRASACWLAANRPEKRKRTRKSTQQPRRNAAKVSVSVRAACNGCLARIACE